MKGTVFKKIIITSFKRRNGVERAAMPPSSSLMLKMTDKRKKTAINVIIWILEGVLVGFGAILPGISGGTLCVVFGMYRPMIELLSDIRGGLKKHWLMLASFLVGVFIGFVGLSGLAGYLLSVNTTVVTCVFVGFIFGTVPELFSDAGEKGRGKGSYIAMLSAFVIMLGVLYLINNSSVATIEPNVWGFLLCGVLWGLSFIVPGLSSSSLLLFFGLYQPMLDGIGKLRLSVVIPMGVGMLVCLLLLARLMEAAFGKYHSILSHAIVGIVVATTVMILPSPQSTTFMGIFIYIISIIGGAALSFLFTVLCAKLKAKTEIAECADADQSNVQDASGENSDASKAQETDDWWFQ